MDDIAMLENLTMHIFNFVIIKSYDKRETQSKSKRTKKKKNMLLTQREKKLNQFG
jgi:hypothetical protein